MGMYDLSETSGREDAVRDMRELLAKGAALVVTLALVGCSASKPAKEADVQQWYKSSSVSQRSFESQTWDGSSSYSGSDSTTTTYKLDKHGNVLTQTELTDYKTDTGSTQSEITVEYTRDDNGWPLTKRQMEQSTSTYSYDDGTGEMVEETSVDGPFVNVIEYSYEYDDKGRVTKTKSTDANDAEFELTYDDNDNVTTCVRREPFYTSQGKALQRVVTSEYNAEGKQTLEEVLTVDEFDQTVSVAHSDYDADGLVTKTVTTRPQEKGSDLVETREYAYEKNADGSYTKLVETITGDGVSTSDRVPHGNNSDRLRETYLPDGSIKVQTISYAPDYSEVLGDAQTYPGPYAVSEQSFDDAGNITSYSRTYYDGSVYSFENSYDDKGNLTSATYSYEDGSSYTYEYTYDKKGNQTASKLVKFDYPDGSSYKVTAEDTTTEWTYVKEPSPFLAINDKFLGW